MIERSDTGAFVFCGPDAIVLVVPPFPVEDAMSLDGWRDDVLRAHLERPRRVVVLLLRLGGFAVGIYEGRALVSSKVGSRFVKGRHSKGGSSQARFARRREEQMRALFGKACEVLRAQVEGYRGTLDHFLTGGDRRTLAAFEKECRYVESLEKLRLRRVLHVGDPRLATLQGLGGKLYESTVIVGEA